MSCFKHHAKGSGLRAEGQGGAGQGRAGQVGSNQVQCPPHDCLMYSMLADHAVSSAHESGCAVLLTSAMLDS